MVNDKDLILADDLLGLIELDLSEVASKPMTWGIQQDFPLEDSNQNKK